MVQILPLVGAAALLAQTAFAAAVPVRRTYDSGSSYNSNNNNYNSGSSYNSDNQADVYQQSSNQDSNQYGSNSYNSGSNSYNSGSNSYDSGSNSYNSGSNSYNSNQYGSNQYNNDVSQAMDMNMYTTTSEDMMMTTTEMALALETTAAAMMYDTTTSSMMDDSTSTMMMDDTTSSMMMDDNTVLQQDISTTATYALPSYGSGSSNYGGGYNNCVQQCMAQFGAPPSTMTMDSQDSLPPPTGSGAVHTILVAPEGAGLRYMPFAVNASIGDTIRYVWTTPLNHTATLSSALAICNKSGIADQRDFASGVRNASAGTQVFDVTVQTSDPQFFYCSVAEHCSKGMFGIINPSNNLGAPSTVGTMMSSLMQSNPQLQAAYSYMIQNVTGTSAMNWGMGMSLDGIPESQYEEVAANVLFTQANFAANPGMLESNQGAYNPDGSPIQIVSGLNVLLSDTTATPSSSAEYGSYSAPPAPTGSLTPVNAAYSGAMSTRSVSTWVAAIVGVAGWLLI